MAKDISCLLYTSPPDLEVHIIAVTPAAVGVTGLVGEGRKCAHQRVLCLLYTSR